jgi:hypothetical protein
VVLDSGLRQEGRNPGEESGEDGLEREVGSRAVPNIFDLPSTLTLLPCDTQCDMNLLDAVPPSHVAKEPDMTTEPIVAFKRPIHYQTLLNSSWNTSVEFGILVVISRFYDDIRASTEQG